MTSGGMAPFWHAGTCYRVQFKHIIGREALEDSVYADLLNMTPEWPKGLNGVRHPATAYSA